MNTAGAAQRSMVVAPLCRAAATPLILEAHYLHRLPSMSYIFGLHDGHGNLEGVVTFGVPVSAALRKGLLGDGNQQYVLELNRLVLRHNHRNNASFLVANALRQIRKPYAVVSYADIGQGHNGAVYRACNFLYTGLSAKRTNWTLDGDTGKYPQALIDEFRHLGVGRAAAIREKYGDRFSLVQRTRKHRYVTFTGTRREKRMLRSLLKYTPLQFTPSAQASA